MDRKFKKLDAEKVTELEKYETRQLSEDELRKVAGGIYGFGPSACPSCGSPDIFEQTFLIQGGPDSGRLEVYIGCRSCGYYEWWGDI